MNLHGMHDGKRWLPCNGASQWFKLGRIILLTNDEKSYVALLCNGVRFMPHVPVRHRYFKPQLVKQLARIGLVARCVVEGFLAGLHRSPYRGFSLEFTEHREYSPGDDLRYLDWKVYGRLDRYYIKQFEQETNLRAYILLDASRSMGYRSRDVDMGVALSKWEYACYLTASLAYLITLQQDAIALIVFADKILHSLPPRSSRGHLNNLFGLLERIEPHGATRMTPVLHQLAENIKKRGLLILLSDLLDDQEEVLRGIKHLHHRGHDVLVFHVLDPDELRFPFRGQIAFEDVETGALIRTDATAVVTHYIERMENWIERYRREFRERRIDYVIADTTTPFDRFLVSYLARRSKL